MFSDADRALLALELTNDPEGLGYAAAIAAGDWARVGAILATGSPGSTRPREVMAKGDFLLAITPALVRLAGQTDAVQRKWDRLLAAIHASESFRVSDPRLQSLLGLAIVDALLTAPEVLAITHAPCPRIEAVLGRAVSGLWDAADLNPGEPGGTTPPADAGPIV